MSVERIPISSLLDVPVYLTTTGEPSGRSGMKLELREKATDVLLATVDSEDLFDTIGNRFHYDAD